MKGREVRAWIWLEILGLAIFGAENQDPKIVIYSSEGICQNRREYF